MLTEHAPSLWTIAHPFRLAGADFGTRTTVVRLADGGLWLHAPGPLEDADAAAIDALGPVRALVAPNTFHHLYIGDARARWPQARTFAAPGLETKRKDLVWDEILSEEPPALWKGEIEQTRLAGADSVSEFAFFHRASRTLILTDAVFNFGRERGLTGIMLRVFGAYDRLGPSRLMRLLTKDRAASQASRARVLEWDFDRIVVAHGAVVESGGRERLRAAFAGS